MINLRKCTGQMQQRNVQLSKNCAFRPTSLLTRSNTPLGSQISCKSASFFDVFSMCFFVSFWADFGTLSGPISVPKWHSKSMRKIHRESIEHWTQKGAKCVSKSTEKSMLFVTYPQKADCIETAVLLQNYSVFRRSRQLKNHKNQAKINAKSMCEKLCKNSRIIEQKLSQHGS